MKDISLNNSVINVYHRDTAHRVPVRLFTFIMLLGWVAGVTGQIGEKTAPFVSLQEFPQNRVMVVAHRGNWREAPENSIWAIKKAVEYGADMVEIDLALTKDSVLILMHDKTIDRTTIGKGLPSEYTLEEIKSFYLRDGTGHATQMRIPTLREVFEVSKGNVFLNLDKGFDYFDLVFPLLEEYDMLEEVLFKGNVDYQTFNARYGHLKGKIFFMPVIELGIVGKEKAMQIIGDYLQNYIPYGFEFTIGSTEENLLDFGFLRQENIRIWVNSLWPEHNVGHHDDLALINPNVYNWYIQNNINIIQTDRLKELSDFLRRVGLKSDNGM